MIRLYVKALGLQWGSNTPTLILMDENEERLLPMTIGQPEAQAIMLALQGKTPPRPLTHDLLKDVIMEMKATLQKVIIVDLREQVYHANIILELNGKEVVIDSRPSDGIALALRADTPVFITEDVAERAMVGAELEIKEVDGQTSYEIDKEQFQDFIENIKPSDFKEQ